MGGFVSRALRLIMHSDRLNWMKRGKPGTARLTSYPPPFFPSAIKLGNTGAALRVSVSAINSRVRANP